jgi:hypothetical protein
MNSKRIIGLEEFRKVVDELATETKIEFSSLYFDYAGIIPVNDKSFRYDCSPINTEEFARTGGDGVHYSVLEISQKIQPIVMTVPMNFGDSMREINWIVAENLNEFLSIGYYNGWFPIEQLCYDNNWVIDFYSKEDMEENYQQGADIQFVKKLRSKLEYDFIPLNNERLSELADNYFQYLKFNPEFVKKYIKNIN